MLIDFTVENYRSIRQPVTLSLVAQRPAKKRSNTRGRIRVDHQIAASVSVEGRGIQLLPALGIFGANASGKTNVVRALGSLLEFIQLGRVGRPGSVLPVWFPPFKLDEESSRLPTRFELRAARAGEVYTYHLAFDRSRILEEKLEFIPRLRKRSQNRLVFERKWSDETQAFRIRNGPDLGEAYRELQESLAESEPFMNLLVDKFNVGIVSNLAQWLKVAWPNLTPRGEGLDEYAVNYTLARSPRYADLSSKMVRAFDTGISRIKVEQAKAGGDEFEVWVEHDVNGVPVRWGMEDESAGTQRLFGLSGKLIAALHTGSLVIIDELSSSIHPNIARAIVRLFQSETSNPAHAQLIFTSHDNTLQRGNLLRRDQIWFTEKRDDGTTNLYPLTDFHPRNDLALDKAYLDGRFGAVPIIPSDDDLIAALETSK